MHSEKVGAFKADRTENVGAFRAEKGGGGGALGPLYGSNPPSSPPPQPWVETKVRNASDSHLLA